MICTRLPVDSGRVWVVYSPQKCSPVCPDHHIGLTPCQLRGWMSICCWVCASDFVPHAHSEFLQPLEGLAPAGQQKHHLPEVLLALLVRGVWLLGLWHKIYSLLLQSISIPSSQDFQEGLSEVQTLTFLFALIYFFFPPESFTVGIAQERIFQSA